MFQMWCKSSGDITCNCKSKYIRRSTCFLLRAACFSFVMITQQRCNSPGNLDFTFFLNVCFYSLRIDSLTVWDVCDVCLTCVGFCKSHTSFQKTILQIRKNILEIRKNILSRVTCASSLPASEFVSIILTY